MRLRQAAKHLSYGLRTHSGREFSNTAAKWETNPASATIPTDACDTEAELPVEFRDGKPRPVHKRRHGNSSLPLPPFMDPSIKAQKERHKTPKPLPGPKERTPFQQKLYENPYAQALATPVRVCKITDALLPSYFFLDFHDMLPPADAPEPSSPSPPSSDSNPTPTPTSPSSSTSAPSSSTKPSKPRRPHPGPTHWLLPLPLHRAAHRTSHPTHPPNKPIRILARRTLLRYLSGSDVKAEARRRRMLWAGPGGGRRERVWREDMADLVGGLLREVVVGKLAWVVRHGGGRLVEGVEGIGWGEWMRGVSGVEGVGCVLVMVRGLSERVVGLERRLEEWERGVERDVERFLDLELEIRKTWLGSKGLTKGLNKLRARNVNLGAMYMPMELPTIQYGGGEVPVYNLVDMLGLEKAGKLVKGTAFEGMKCIVLKKSYQTTSPQMWLNKLQAYLADDLEV